MLPIYNHFHSHIAASRNTVKITVAHLITVYYCMVHYTSATVRITRVIRLVGYAGLLADAASIGHRKREIECVIIGRVCWKCR